MIEHDAPPRAAQPLVAAPPPSTPADACDPVAWIANWRAQRPQADAITLAVAEGLARRAAIHQGATRAFLLQRLAALGAAKPEAVVSSSAQAVAPSDPDEPEAPTVQVLATLVDRLGRSEPASHEPVDDQARPSAPPAVSRPAPKAPAGTRAASSPPDLSWLPGAQERAARLAAPPSGQRRGMSALSTLTRAMPPKPLKSVAAFGKTWSRLRADQRLRQAMSQVPDRPGPLNSAAVVNRALQTLRGISPAYLEAFMAHVDTLIAIEHSSGLGDLAPRAAPAATDLAAKTTAGKGSGKASTSKPANRSAAARKR